jgi:hypothetical protein
MNGGNSIASHFFSSTNRRAYVDAGDGVRHAGRANILTDATSMKMEILLGLSGRMAVVAAIGRGWDRKTDFDC